MTQSNIMKEEPKMGGHNKVFPYRQHKIQKKICINRHIIKYNVITEQILICGVAMETDFWRVRDASTDPSRASLNPLTSDRVSPLGLLSTARASSSYPHSPSK